MSDVAGDLLLLRFDPAADCGNVRGRGDQIDREIAKLHQIRSALDKLIASRSGGGALRAGTILDALSLIFIKYVDRKQAARKTAETMLFAVTRAVFIGALGILAAC